MEITGATRIFCLIGSPIAQARSPALFNRIFAEAGIDAVCLALDVPANGLQECFLGLKATGNIDGLFVTTPHKRAIVGALDDCTQTSRTLGSVNIVRRDSHNRWIGAMFDGIGTVLALRAHGNDVAGREVMLVGCGGAGRAIGLAVAEAGASRLSLVDINLDQARALAELLKSVNPNCAIEAKTEADKPHDVAINATTLGMKPDDPSPIDLASLQPSNVIVDLTGEPGQTALGRGALETGCTVVGGLAVHGGQAVFAARYIGADYWPANWPQVPIDDLLRA